MGRRGARVVEWGGLENRYARKRIESSNLSSSAIIFHIGPKDPIWNIIVKK